MTIEEKLKGLIVSRYGSAVNFCKVIDMPKSTLATILKSGVNKASVLNIIRICQELEISADELAQGKIVPVAARRPNYIDEWAMGLRESIDDHAFVMGSKPLSDAEKELLLDAIDIAVELIQRKRMRDGR